MTGIAEQFNSRPSLLTQYNYYNPTENVLHLGVVCSYSQLNNLLGKALVYIPKLRYCLNATYAAGYQGLNNTGDYHPLLPGESVLVSYLEGVTEAAQIVGHKRWSSNLDQLLDPNKELLVTSSENIAGGGIPGSQIVDVLKLGGLSHVNTYPVASNKESKNNQNFRFDQIPILEPFVDFDADEFLRGINSLPLQENTPTPGNSDIVEQNTQIIDKRENGGGYIDFVAPGQSTSPFPSEGYSPNGLEITEPGATTINTVNGDRIETVPGTISTEADEIVNNTTSTDNEDITDRLQTKVSETERLLERLRIWRAEKNKIPQVSQTSITTDSSTSTNLNDYPNHNQTEQQLGEASEQLAEAEAAQIEKDIEKIEKEEECIEEATEQVKEKSRKFFDKLLDEIVNQVKSVALEKLNKLLPSFLSIDIEVERDEQDEIVVTRVRVGDVTYEVKSGTIIFNGEVFRPLENLLVSEINKILPPFLRVTASELGIRVGSVVIKTKDIDSTKEQSFPINENSVLLNRKGTIFIQFAGAIFSLGRLEDLVVEKTSSEVSRLVNQVLPDFLQFSIFQDSEGHTTISLGPFSVKLSGSGAGLSVDYISLQSIINIIPNKLISRLSPPVALIARILWEPLSDGVLNLIKDLILGPDRNKIKKEEEVESISKQIDPCRGEQRNIPPIIFDTFPSDTTYPSYPAYA
jgi:hypothetical protein